MVSLAGQFIAFLVMIGAGLLVGLIFDIYRVVRALSRPRAKSSMIMDLLFWVLVTPAFFLMLVAGNWGELRFYVFLGAALGLFVYFQVISPIVLWSLVSFARWLGRVIAMFIYTIAHIAAMPVSIWRQLRLSWFRLCAEWQRKLRSLTPKRSRHFRRRPLFGSAKFRITPPWGKTWPFIRR